MKTDTILHVLAFFIAVLMFSTPFTTLAQESAEQADMGTAEADAIQDANADVNKPLWVGLGGLLAGLTLIHDYGCVLSVGGLAGTHFYRPNPPAERLIGKSPEYVNVYSEAYKNEIAKLHTLWSAAGCVGGGVIIAGFAVVGFIRLGITAGLSENGGQD